MKKFKKIILALVIGMGISSSAALAINNNLVGVSSATTTQISSTVSTNGDNTKSTIASSSDSIDNSQTDKTTGGGCGADCSCCPYACGSSKNN